MRPRPSVRPRLALGYCQIMVALAIAWTAYAISDSLPYWPIDTTLATRFTAPVPGAHFDRQLRRRIAADRRRALWESAPDLLHLGGGLAGSAICAWLLPEAAGKVMFFGAGFTLTAYVLQVVVRGWLEQAE